MTANTNASEVSLSETMNTVPTSSNKTKGFEGPLQNKFADSGDDDNYEVFNCSKVVQQSFNRDDLQVSSLSNPWIVMCTCR